MNKLFEIHISSEKKKPITYLINALKKRQRDLNAPKFCFLLGAGTSVNAGIPSGGGLTGYVQKRCFIQETLLDFSDSDLTYKTIDAFIMANNLEKDLNDFIENTQKNIFNRKIDLDRDKWINSIPESLKKSLIGKPEEIWPLIKEEFYKSCYYGLWFDNFSESPRDRQELVEELIDGNEPSAGYILLSLLVEKDIVRHFFTTNFDDLIHDAIFTEAGRKAKVFAHNETAHFINFKSTRSNIIKLHGDYLYQDMRNTVEETSKLSDNQSRKLKEAANDFGLVIIGYSGSDQSIMLALEAIKKERGSDFPVIWCSRNEDSLNWRAKHFIEHSSNTFFVEIGGFDELMSSLVVSYDCNLKTLEQRFDKVKDYDARISYVLGKGLQNKDLKEQVTIRQILSTIASEKSTTNKYTKIETAIQRFPLEDILWSIKGKYFYELGNFKEAINAYDRAIDLNENNSTYYTSRGSCKGRINDNNGAIEDFNKAIAIDSNNATAYNNRGSVKGRLEQYEEALLDFDKAVKLRPNDDMVYNNRGNSKRKLMQLQSAMKDIEMAISINPENGYTYSTLAEIYSQQGNSALFYENIILALKKGCPVWEMTDDTAYSPYIADEKFISLLEEYKPTDKID